ncbi:MAG: KilA-N domain-containing protein [Sulfuriferula sp.]
MSKNKLIVQEMVDSLTRINDSDFISLTDIARVKNPTEPKDVVKNWLRSRSTIEFLGLWERINNPDFKGVEFDPLKNAAGSNSFTLSPNKWIETTGAIGIKSTQAGAAHQPQAIGLDDIAAGARTQSRTLFCRSGFSREKRELVRTPLTA